MGKQKGFFFLKFLPFLGAEKRQELEQNKCEKLQLGEHWVLDIFSYLLLDYVTVSAFELGTVFFLG